MTKKTKLTEDDLRCFQEAMKDVTPFKKKSAISLNVTPKPPYAAVRIPQEPAKSVFQFDDTESTEPVAGETAVSFKHTSIAHKILRKLMKGQYNLDRRLDLHGMTVDQARTTLDIFLQTALREGARVVLIIHGKGRVDSVPVLKNRVTHWLRSLPVVLAFSSAAPIHGGTGATYVLLKTSSRGEKA